MSPGIFDTAVAFRMLQGLPLQVLWVMGTTKRLPGFSQACGLCPYQEVQSLFATSQATVALVWAPPLLPCALGFPPASPLC